jgi:predicted Fe-Mo cluster-binding NifX family protein
MNTANSIKHDGKKLKIAIASDQGSVTGHFGHCENFQIFTADNGNILEKSIVPNPGHKPGFLPVFLHEQGVHVIISGGMGGGAEDLFNEKGIEVVIGVQGACDTIAHQYLQGELKSTGSICHDHQHHDTCGQ